MEELYKVIVTARSFGTTDSGAEELLAANGCRVLKLEGGEVPVRERLEQEIDTADAVIAGLDDFDQELLDRAKHLKVISRYGVGYDKVDLEAARERDIKVTITPGANGDSVADMAVALMLDSARNVTIMSQGMKERQEVRPAGVEMCHKTLGIIGTGRIGKGVAYRCRGFAMKILCYDPFPDPAFAKECQAAYVPLEQIFRDADFITLHLPLLPETRNMIGREELSMMKRDAIIVNTARGGIINEEALYEALKEGRIRAAGLDATVSEPAFDSPLTTLPNCIITPHAGAATKEAGSRMSLMAAENVLSVLRDGTCRFAV